MNDRARALRIRLYYECEHRAEAVRTSAGRRGNIAAAIRAGELECSFHDKWPDGGPHPAIP
jgi:hypothetical protein